MYIEKKQEKITPINQNLGMSPFLETELLQIVEEHHLDEIPVEVQEGIIEAGATISKIKDGMGAGIKATMASFSATLKKLASDIKKVIRALMYNNDVLQKKLIALKEEILKKHHGDATLSQDSIKVLVKHFGGLMALSNAKEFDDAGINRMVKFLKQYNPNAIIDETLKNLNASDPTTSFIDGNDLAGATHLYQNVLGTHRVSDFFSPKGKLAKIVTRSKGTFIRSLVGISKKPIIAMQTTGFKGNTVVILALTIEKEKLVARTVREPIGGKFKQNIAIKEVAPKMKSIISLIDAILEFSKRNASMDKGLFDAEKAIKSISKKDDFSDVTAFKKEYVNVVLPQIVKASSMKYVTINSVLKAGNILARGYGQFNEKDKFVKVSEEDLTFVNEDLKETEDLDMFIDTQAGFDVASVRHGLMTSLLAYDKNIKLGYPVNEELRESLLGVYHKTEPFDFSGKPLDILLENMKVVSEDGVDAVTEVIAILENVIYDLELPKVTEVSETHEEFINDVATTTVMKISKSTGLVVDVSEGVIDGAKDLIAKLIQKVKDMWSEMFDNEEEKEVKAKNEAKELVRIIKTNQTNAIESLKSLKLKPEDTDVSPDTIGLIVKIAVMLDADSLKSCTKTLTSATGESLLMKNLETIATTGVFQKRFRSDMTKAFGINVFKDVFGKKITSTATSKYAVIGADSHKIFLLNHYEDNNSNYDFKVLANKVEFADDTQKEKAIEILSEKATFDKLNNLFTALIQTKLFSTNGHTKLIKSFESALEKSEDGNTIKSINKTMKYLVLTKRLAQQTKVHWLRTFAQVSKSLQNIEKSSSEEDTHIELCPEIESLPSVLSGTEADRRMLDLFKTMGDEATPVTESLVEILDILDGRESLADVGEEDNPTLVAIEKDTKHKLAIQASAFFERAGESEMAVAILEAEETEDKDGKKESFFATLYEKLKEYLLKVKDYIVNVFSKDEKALEEESVELEKEAEIVIEEMKDDITGNPATSFSKAEAKALVPIIATTGKNNPSTDDIITAMNTLNSFNGATAEFGTVKKSVMKFTGLKALLNVGMSKSLKGISKNLSIVTSGKTKDDLGFVISLNPKHVSFVGTQRNNTGDETKVIIRKLPYMEAYSKILVENLSSGEFNVEKILYEAITTLKTSQLFNIDEAKGTLANVEAITAKLIQDILKDGKTKGDRTQMKVLKQKIKDNKELMVLTTQAIKTIRTDYNSYLDTLTKLLKARKKDD